MLEYIEITEAAKRAIEEGLAYAYYGDHFQLTINCVYDGIEMPVRIIMVPEDIPNLPVPPKLKPVPKESA